MLAGSQHSWLSQGQIREESVQRRPALIAGAHTVAALLFEVLQKCENFDEAQILDS